MSVQPRPVLLACMLMIALPGVRARADVVTLDTKLRYDPVNVLMVERGVVSFDLNGRIIEKPLSEVESIRLTSSPAFIAAEDAWSRGEWARAAEAFEALAEPNDLTPVAVLSRWRAISAWSRAGRIDRALRVWAVLARDGLGIEILRLRPDLSASSDAEAIGRAIVFAQAAAEDARARGDNALAEALLEILPSSHRSPASGRALASAPSPRLDPAASEGQPNPLAQAESLLAGGRPAEALGAIEQAAPLLGEQRRPLALLISGRARMALASTDQARRRGLLLDAGLEFMRVFAYWPASEQAPEALYRAALINEALGNLPAAAAAMNEVADRWPDSAWAERARTWKPGRGAADEAEAEEMN